jgi:phage-related baseplate assembly protein
MAFQTINLAALPSPSAVQVWTFDAIHDATLADAVARLNANGVPYNVETLKGNPMNFVVSSYAWREGLMLQRINDAVKSTFLALAPQLADVTLRAADVNVTAAPGEGVESVRKRAQLQWEALAIGGTYGRYMAQALGADPVNLADVAVYGHEIAAVPLGQVRIVCLGANASGIPSNDTLARVAAATAPRGVRPVNDQVVVKAVNPANYVVKATIYLADGADPATVLDAQIASLAAFVQARRKIGVVVKPGDIKAVLGFNTAPLVEDVDVRAPASNVGGDPFQAPVCLNAGTFAADITWARKTS